MIVIRIENVRDLVRRSSRVVARLGKVVDLEAVVEAEVVEQIVAAFEQQGVRATVQSVRVDGDALLLTSLEGSGGLFCGSGVKVRSSRPAEGEAVQEQEADEPPF